MSYSSACCSRSATFYISADRLWEAEILTRALAYGEVHFQYVVLISMTASGTVADYTSSVIDQMTTLLANAITVPTSSITIDVSAAVATVGRRLSEDGVVISVSIEAGSSSISSRSGAAGRMWVAGGERNETTPERGHAALRRTDCFRAARSAIGSGRARISAPRHGVAGP